MKILSPDQIRAAEAQADARGVTYEQMMENAGRGCAEYILRNYRDQNKIAILVGKGKNGGDGFVCARYLSAAGKKVSVIRLYPEKSDALSERMRDVLPLSVQQIGYFANPADAENTMEEAEIIVDAIFGIGFKGHFSETVRACVAFANKQNAVRIALDLPSGVGDNAAESVPFAAQITLSMFCLKKEQVYAPFRGYCGKTEIIPIGIDCDAHDAVDALTRREVALLLPPRPFDAHKGTFGNVLIVGGSRNMPGAPLLAASGALRCGAGVVSLAVPSENLQIAASAEPECVFVPLATGSDGFLKRDSFSVLREKLASCSAVVLGNGMGRSADVASLVADIILNAVCPVVLDADGINAVAAHKHILKEAKAPLLLTPHPGEMSRLTGNSISQINADRENNARRFAKEYGVYLLLKGANTVIAAPNGTIRVNGTGCPALARGGSGDVLAGMIGALLAQGMKPFDALSLAAYIHGFAGEISMRRFTSFCATTRENIRSLSLAFQELLEGM